MKALRCLVVDDDAMQCALLVEYLDRSDQLLIEGAFKDPVDALKYMKLHGEQIDVLFLDVEMPKLSGLDFLESINYQGKVVLVTAEARYALEGYQHQVFDFLLKPVSYERFQAVTRRLLEQGYAVNEVAKDDSMIYFKVNGVVKKFDLQEILFFKGADDYVELHLEMKKYLLSERLSQLENKLPDSFMRIHRGTIVNRTRINEFDGSGVEVGGHYLPVSKTYRPTLIKILKT